MASGNSANKEAAPCVKRASGAATDYHAPFFPWEFQGTPEASWCCNPLLILYGAHMQL